VCSVLHHTWAVWCALLTVLHSCLLVGCTQDTITELEKQLAHLRQEVSHLQQHNEETKSELSASQQVPFG